MTFQWRWLVDGSSEGVLSLARVGAADHLVGWLVTTSESAGVVGLHREWIVIMSGVAVTD